MVNMDKIWINKKNFEEISKKNKNNAILLLLFFSMFILPNILCVSYSLSQNNSEIEKKIYRNFFINSDFP